MLDNNQLVILFTLFSALYVLPKVVGFVRMVRSIRNWPGFRTVFSDQFLLFPFSVRGISPGPQMTFYSKYRPFAQAGWDVLSGVNFFPKPRLVFFIADPAVVKEIIGARARYPKPLEAYDLLATFGTNILVTEGDEWKRQRKIVAPAFSEKNNRLVWEETVQVVEDLFQNVWGDKEVIAVDHIMDITVQIALMVISAAGFGRRSTWTEDKIAPPGHSMTFKDALHDVSHNMIVKVLFPEWMLRWGTPLMRHFICAYGELENYMAEMVQARRSAKTKEERNDLFSNLLDANEDELDSAAQLTDSALLGNVFIFLVAGYETTAHTLAFAFILLALYQEEQEAFYQNIKATLPSDWVPTYDEFSSLSYSMAVFNETLRWFPPVVNIPKRNVEDTFFVTTNAAGEKASVVVPRGSYISICTPSLHNNPRYWDEPDTFNPRRFLSGDYPRDAFLPFSGGPRGCVGRGFAETEGVAVLSLIVSRYRVEVKEEPRFAGETFAQRRARLLKCNHSLTVYPDRAPLVFKRR